MHTFEICVGPSVDGMNLSDELLTRLRKSAINLTVGMSKSKISNCIFCYV